MQRAVRSALDRADTAVRESVHEATTLLAEKEQARGQSALRARLGTRFECIEQILTLKHKALLHFTEETSNMLDGDREQPEVRLCDVGLH